jgi:Flp pilus assembly pilin Flp
VFVEYAVLLACVSLACVAALIAIGVPLLHAYQLQRAWLSLPIP